MLVSNFLIFILIIAVFRLYSNLGDSNKKLEDMYAKLERLNKRLQQLESKDKIQPLVSEKATATIHSPQTSVQSPPIAVVEEPQIPQAKQQPQIVQASEEFSATPPKATPPIPQKQQQPQRKARPQAPKRPKAKKPTRPPQPNVIEQAFAFAKNWLTTGNIPVKVGMLVLLSAVIAFLRYATTMGWLHIPIEMKLLGVAISALATLIFAWKKRHTKRSFALIMQGGSIGVILLVIFSAVKMYSLMSAPVGFILSVAFICLTAVLSIQQNAKALAIMAIFAGFLAPIWLSQGTGNHVILFSYYAILNVGIFIIALLKPWRELSLLGFIFTYLIGSTWGGLNYTSEHFATTEPFVILFFLLYLFIPLRFAQQTQALLNEGEEINNNDFYHKYRLSSGLLFGTPLVTFVAQGALLKNNDHLAISCVIIGLVYAILAFVLHGYRSEEHDDEPMFSTLQKAYTGLSAIFFTLAVPIGLSAKATTTIFALEGVGAVWLGARANPQKRNILTWLAGGFLQVSSAVGFFVAYGFYYHAEPKIAFMNEVYLSGVLLAISALLCAWFSFRAVKVAEETGKNDAKVWLTNDVLKNSARIFFIGSMVWWLSINVYEMSRMHTNSLQNMYIYMIELVITAVLLLRLYLNPKGYQDSIVWRMASLLLMTVGYFALVQWIGEQISEGWAIITWLIVAIGGWLVWRGLRSVRSTWLEFAIAIWLISIMTSISTLVYDLIYDTWGGFNTGLYQDGWQRNNNLYKSGWYWGAIFAVWIGFALVNNYRPQAIAWLGQRPIDSENKSQFQWQIMVSWLTMAVLACVFLQIASLSGGEGWWLPVLNSLDGLQIILAITLVLSIDYKQKEFRSIVMAVLFLIVISIITLRGVYHYATASEIVWGMSMFSQAVVQMALTVVWSVLGVVAWIVGSKRLSKPIWLLGAVLMAVVLLKLMLIDREHLGNLFGIGSFFAYGVLCVIVGYFAPIPQIEDEEE